MEKINYKNILSWLLFLPSSILVTIIAIKLLGYFNDFSMYRMGYSDSSIFNKFYEAISTGIVNGYVFVFIGSFIVPKYKKQVAVILALMINIFLIKEFVSQYSSLNSGESFYFILFLIMALISSLMAMFGVINPDSEN
jgi:hypothetical protein